MNEEEKLRVELEKLVQKYEADIKYLKAGDADVDFLYTLRKVTQEVKTYNFFLKLYYLSRYVISALLTNFFYNFKYQAEENCQSKDHQIRSLNQEIQEQDDNINRLALEKKHAKEDVKRLSDDLQASEDRNDNLKKVGVAFLTR